MSEVVIISTGGTIASRADAAGAQVAAVGGEELLLSVSVPGDLHVRVRDLFSINSFAMDVAEMDAIRRAVDQALADQAVTGVVVTHGTDTLEETAFLVDLFHSDPRPVIFTGAQRSADASGGDGPANLADAIRLAACASVRGLGVLIAFNGSVYPARGSRKSHTTAPDTFSNRDAGPLGYLDQGRYTPAMTTPACRQALRGEDADFSGIRVDTVALYPGVDSTAIDAYVAGGAHGLVLEATGTGNANPVVAAAVARHTAAGVPIVLSTRVDAGPVSPIYGGGGGFDLVASGAIPAGLLRPSQARIQLLALLATRSGRERICDAFSAAAPECTEIVSPPASSTEGKQ